MQNRTVRFVIEFVHVVACNRLNSRLKLGFFYVFSDGPDALGHVR